MRIALAALVLTAAAGSAARAEVSPDVAACRNVADSLLRLRCFDDAAKGPPAKVVSSNPSVPTAPNFAQYPAAPYRGTVSPPDFRGRDRQYASYRTRIMDGFKSGPNFAGKLSVVEIGCGAGCRFVYVIDIQSGRVMNFPLGGEDNLYLNMTYKTDSRLLSAQWVSDERCKSEFLIWTGTEFQRGKVIDIGDREKCG
ncbi:hypothetical protein [Methylobacterium sp. WL116]|uniref:hypothetical protein n=1 Tax=Methylobacterium sp. WL116 TaxID=2603889 RepID=UPI0011C7C4F2|nr:hypothetical protein [Methylobacterium sp. WL116]TXM95410.1 hypothetical protein FV223_00615 [Methylobacterium sp. WL116]